MFTYGVVICGESIKGRVWEFVEFGKMSKKPRVKLPSVWVHSKFLDMLV